ncbi:MAG: hypothetical protein AB8G17_05505 [Gammaproteobacteria bacterium]
MSASAPCAQTDPDPTVKLARRLTLALGVRDEEDFRLAVLKRVARRFGDDDYPEFIRLLLTVACSHDVRAKRLVAQTLGIALKKMDLPSGQISSWGASKLQQPTQPQTASQLSGYFASGAPQRRLGPLEYLTVWHYQRTQRVALGADAYAFALRELVSLINHNDDTRRRYVDRLGAESERQIEGTYTGSTRAALARLAKKWRAESSPQSIAQAVADDDAATDKSPTGVTADWVIRTL